MEANKKEQLKESILKQINEDVINTFYEYLRTHPKETDIGAYIKENRLVDISKKYTKIEILESFTENFDINFLNMEKFTYQTYDNIVSVIGFVAYKNRMLYKYSRCERKRDGTILILPPSHPYYTDCEGYRCWYNRTFKYKEEAAKEGYKSLEEKYEFYKQSHKNTLESIPSRVEDELNESHIETTEEEKDELISSITEKYKAFMDKNLDSFQLYKKEE